MSTKSAKTTESQAAHLALSPASLGMYKDMPWIKSTLERLKQQITGVRPRKPVFQIHSQDRASAMREVVARAERFARDRGMEVFHLEASRFGDREFAYTPEQFIRPLVTGLLSTERRRKEDCSSPEGYARLVDDLRHRLTLRACLVVVHGLQNAVGRTAPTIDFITGMSNVIDVVRSLAVPPIQARVREATPATSARTILLTCSLHPVAELIPYSERVEAVDLQAWEVPDWKEVVLREVARRGHKSALVRAEALSVETGVIERAYSTAHDLLIDRPYPPSDVELLLALTVDTWRSGHQNARKHVIADRLRKTPLSSAQELMELWVRSLAQYDEAGLWFLALIAATPEGLVLGTLKRLADHAGALIKHNTGLPKPRPSSSNPASKRQTGMDRAWTDCLGLIEHMSMGPGQERDFDSPLLKDYQPVLAVVSEEVTEHLAPRILRWEVGAIGRETQVAGKRVDEGDHRGARRSRIRFANPVLRDCFLLAFSRMDQQLEPAADGRPTFEHCIRLIQLAAAAEAFAQGTALQLHSDPNEALLLQRRRLHAQALHHAASAGDLQGLDLDIGAKPQRAILPFPQDPERRRHVVYMVLYRQLVEDRGAWTLSRRHGRSELRVSLLLQLLAWGEMAYPFCGPGQGLSQAELTGPYSHGWVGQVVPLLKHARKGTRFQRMMVKNLSYASIDAEDIPLANALLALEEAADPDSDSKSERNGTNHLDSPKTLKSFRLGQLQINLQLQVRDESHEAVEPKLGFALQDHQSPSLAEATCRAAIEESCPGLCDSIMYCAAEFAADFVHRDPSAFNFVEANKRLEQLGLSPLIDQASPVGATADRATYLADWCVRWADCLANNADDLPHSSAIRAGHPQQDEAGEQVKGILQAFVAFWVADFLRARSGEQPDISGVKWGRLASRYYRTGIRTSLKLARLLVDRHKSKAKDLANWLLEFARSRVGILIRDYNALARELFQCMLLLSAIARTYDHIFRLLADEEGSGATGQLPFAPGAGPPDKEDALSDAVEYISDGEYRWIALGGPNSLARRLVAERVNLLQAVVRTYLAALGPPHRPVQVLTAKKIATLLEAIDWELCLFEGLAEGQPFWMKLYKRHISRQRELIAGFKSR